MLQVTLKFWWKVWDFPDASDKIPECSPNWDCLNCQFSIALRLCRGSFAKNPTTTVNNILRDGNQTVANLIEFYSIRCAQRLPLCSTFVNATHKLKQQSNNDFNHLHFVESNVQRPERRPKKFSTIIQSLETDSLKRTSKGESATLTSFLIGWMTRISF